MLDPVGTSKGIDNVDTGRGSSDDRINVGRTGEIGIESDSLGTRFPVQRIGESCSVLDPRLFEFSSRFIELEEIPSHETRP